MNCSPAVSVSLPDDTIIATCVKQLPTTVLTNGGVQRAGVGARWNPYLEGSLCRSALTSATLELHDAHAARGRGVKAVAGNPVGAHLLPCGWPRRPPPRTWRADGVSRLPRRLGIAPGDQLVRPIVRWRAPQVARWRSPANRWFPR